MANDRGVFIVLEGVDGPANAGQFNLLAKRLKAAGYSVLEIDFPRYSNPSSHFVQMYLSGAYGSMGKIGPYTTSLFFALDRFEATIDIRAALEQGKIVLANRFTGSNMAYQGAKLRQAELRRGFFLWLDNLEFEVLKIPRPDKSVVLRMPAKAAQQEIVNQHEQSHVDKKTDAYVSEISHLNQWVTAYDDLCQLFPKDYQRLDCVRNGETLDADTVHKLLWQSIEPFLPSRNAEAIDDSMPKQSAKRLELAPSEETITASALLTAYLVTDDGYKGSQPKIILPATYFTPNKLNIKTAQLYKRTMDLLLATHRDMTAKLQAYAQKSEDPSINKAQIDLLASNILPVATNFAVESAQPSLALKGAYARSRLPEAKGSSLRSAKSPPRTVNKLADELLGGTYGQQEDALRLVSVTPRNELDIIPDILYRYSNLSWAEIDKALSAMPYSKKEEMFLAYIDEQPAGNNSELSCLQSIQYSWDILCDLGTLMALAGNGMGRDAQFQPLSPRYGYDVPELIERAGLAEQYEACFDASLELYSAMQAAGDEILAQYTTLIGHKLRWKVNYTAAEMSKLLALQSPDNGLAYASILDRMRLEVSQVHPLFGQSFKQKQRSEPASNRSHPATSTKKHKAG